jgi:hypothetical protein
VLGHQAEASADWPTTWPHWSRVRRPG